MHGNQTTCGLIIHDDLLDRKRIGSSIRRGYVPRYLQHAGDTLTDWDKRLSYLTRPLVPHIVHNERFIMNYELGSYQV